MDARDKILSILKEAYQVEINGYTFYSMTAKEAKNEATKELFDKLAKDEVEHQNYLKGVAKRFSTEGTEDAFKVKLTKPSMGEFVSKLFTDKFISQAKGAQFELGAVSVGMTLETNAMEIFRRAQEGTESKEVKEFYSFLHNWEKEHFDSLKNFYDQLRKGFWEEGNFSPF